MPVAFDPLDPEFRADPYPTYHRLRAEDPVHFLEFGDFFFLTRYADVAGALDDPRLGAFSFDTMRVFTVAEAAGDDPGAPPRALPPARARREGVHLACRGRPPAPHRRPRGLVPRRRGGGRAHGRHDRS